MACNERSVKYNGLGFSTIYPQKGRIMVWTAIKIFLALGVAINGIVLALAFREILTRRRERKRFYEYWGKGWKRLEEDVRASH